MPSTYSRRTVCAVVLPVVATASGCLGGQQSGDDTGCPPERVTSRPYPARPETLTEQSVREFVTELERAYVHHREARDGETVSVSFDPEPDEVRRVDGGWSARIETGYSEEVCHDGALAVGDGYYVARYFVDEEAVYRAASGGADSPPDPREEGTRITVQSSSEEVLA